MKKLILVILTVNVFQYSNAQLFTKDRLVNNENFDNYPQGTWRHSIISAIESTIYSYPGGDIFVHLDRKSFKGWQRDAIHKLLTEQKIPILRKKEII